MILTGKTKITYDVESTIDVQELNKFAQHANHWWDKEGPLKTLHHINDIRLKFITDHTDLKNKKVLDVGCGGGILTEALARKKATVQGLDAEAEAIEAAKNHALTSKLDIVYHCSPIENFEEQDFDIITCMEMLEHVSQPEVVIKHCVRLLKPGGMLFLSTINRTLISYAQAIVAAEYLLNLLPRQTHDFEKFITPSELALMLREKDLNIVDIKGMEYNPLTKKARYTPSVSVNYMVACVK